LDKTVVATALIPATTEMFSLGLGAGFTTEAVRQEDIEFLVSFSEMIPEFQNTLGWIISTTTVSFHKVYSLKAILVFIR
jgi:hypothetical protein